MNLYKFTGPDIKEEGVLVRARNKDSALQGVVDQLGWNSGDPTATPDEIVEENASGRYTLELIEMDGTGDRRQMTG